MPGNDPYNGWNFTGPNQVAPGADTWETYDATAWGGHGDRVDNQGNNVYGTSDADRDVERYRQMAQQPQYASGPQLDGANDGMMRSYQGDGLGLLQNTALHGSAATQQAATQAIQQGQNAQQSLAGSVRGGPAAQAAAQRMATSNAGDVAARGAMNLRAAQAGEMANARGQWASAANQQHQQDVNYGIAQGQLDAAQRGQNEQASEYYDRLGWETQNAVLGQSLGRTAADQAAANANRAQGLAEDQQQWNNTKTGISTTLGAAQGAAQAYGYDPNDPNHMRSDEHAKEQVHPIDDTQAAYLKTEGEKMLANPYHSPPSTKPKTPRVDEAQAKKLLAWASGQKDAMKAASGKDSDYRDGVYRSLDNSWTPESKPMGTDALHAAIEARIAQDGPTPEEQQLALSQAPHGYARSRQGQAGAMFGPGAGREAVYGAWDNGAGTGKDDEWAGYAPGTTDAADPIHAPDVYSRQIMRSDARAKEEAFQKGRATGMMEADKEAGRPFVVDPAPKPVPTPAQVRAMYEADKKAGVPVVIDQPPTPGMHPKNNAPVPYATVAGLKADPRDAAPDASGLGYISGRFDDGMTAMQDGMVNAAGAMTSDERAKEQIHESPMADAARSMSASSYRYKSGLGPPEQRDGEVNIGPMAQNMAADPVARVAIVKEPDTGLLAIDKDKALKLTMGSVASLQQQIDHMNRRK